MQRTKDFYKNRRLPSIYIPAHVKANVDITQYMLKNPDEQSRYELADFEKSLKNLENPDLMDEDYARSTEEFRVFK